jgi:hypothetical protein
MPLSIRTTAVVVGVLATLWPAAPALAHQTVSSNGATVTLHVAPDDAPVAGVASTISIVNVKVPKHATFRLSRARLRVIDATGTTLLDRRAAKRVSFTFPRSAA